MEILSAEAEKQTRLSLFYASLFEQLLKTSVMS
jgi:hypothetical protein